MSWQEELNKKLQEQRDAFKKSIEDGTTFKRKKSYAASKVSNKTRSKAGKISGKNNVESGHWDSLKTKEHQSNAGKVGGDHLHQQRLKDGFYGSNKHKKISSKGGKTSGKNNVESGHWDSIRHLSIKSIKKEVKCPVCGDKGGNSAMQKNHFNNCKTLELFDALPDTFRMKEAKVICDELQVHIARIRRDKKRYRLNDRIYTKIKENRIS